MWNEVSENRVLRRIFGSKRDEVTGELRKLHSEELNELYSSPYSIRAIKMRWAGHVAHMGRGRCLYRVLVGKPEGKEPLGRPRCRGGNNNINDLQEKRWEGMDWIDMAQDRDRWGDPVNAVMNFRVT